MLSKDVAKWYNAEQRKQVCKWCKEQGKNKCSKCGFTETPPYRKNER